MNFKDLKKKSSETGEEKVILSTGLKNFDKILGGGFYSGKNYLIFGANKTGKTQLSLQLCIQAYKQFSTPKIEKIKISSLLIYYLDTENTFRPERLKELAAINNIDYNKVLKSILVAKIMSNSTLLLTLKNLEDRIEHNNIVILIIDSVNNYFRSEQGNKELSFHKIKTTFIEILKKISEITNKFNIITIATAQITPNFIDNSIIENIPVGNQYLNHFFSECLFLGYKDGKNYVHLVNSESMPERKFPYKITSNGIVDYNI